ncbi:MAG: hypothetical protein ABI456_20655, partial [Ktedonobacteraceae bacterium]
RGLPRRPVATGTARQATRYGNLRVTDNKKPAPTIVGAGFLYRYTARGTTLIGSRPCKRADASHFTDTETQQ